MTRRSFGRFRLPVLCDLSYVHAAAGLARALFKSDEEFFAFADSFKPLDLDLKV